MDAESESTFPSPTSLTSPLLVCTRATRVLMTDTRVEVLLVALEVPRLPVVAAMETDTAVEVVGEITTALLPRIVTVSRTVETDATTEDPTLEMTGDDDRHPLDETDEAPARSDAGAEAVTLAPRALAEVETATAVATTVSHPLGADRAVTSTAPPVAAT